METTTIALVGNPNCGKTTMFNNLTGSNAYVGNWAGVTVEKKEGFVKGNPLVSVIDLPGIYSLSPYTLEEVITRDFLTKEKPDVIINIVDASNLERNLYLTSQLLETGVPVVVALNMMDIVTKRGDDINTQKMEDVLGCAVVKTAASENKGLDELIKKALCATGNKKPQIFSGDVLASLNQIQSLITDHHHTHYLSVKLFERDQKVIADMHLSTEVTEKTEKIIKECEQKLNDESQSIITTARYEFAEKVVLQSYIKKQKNASVSAKIDRVLTNKFFALPFFALIMCAVYYIAITSVGAVLTDWTYEVLFGTYVKGFVSTFLTQIQVAPWLYSLIIDGIIGGVGSVLGFVPQLAILFFLLSILEDSGYMSRVAFIMDALFRGFGLSGKSFIPLLIASGCGVPGIMASRTIENEKERKITIMVTTFIPCGAKLPVIALIAASFFGGAFWVAPSIYFLGIIMVAFSGLILKSLHIFKKDDSPFVMELPNYHLPIAKNIIKTVWDRTKSFIVKAGTIIFVASGVIWFLSNFNFAFKMVPTAQSILATLGGFIAPVFIPLGFGFWQATVATMTGIVAKESVVSTLSVLSQHIESLFTPVSAYAFLVFNMLCAPCVAAISAIRREMGNLKWTIIAVGYQTVVAYIVSLIVYQLGSVILSNLGTSFAAFLVVLCFIFAIRSILKNKKNNACADCSACDSCAQRKSCKKNPL